MNTKVQTQQPNRFKEYHEYLKSNDSIAFYTTVKSICGALGIDTTTYYRKLKAPQKLSIAEKEAIAKVYHLPTHFIFPELEKQIA